MVLTVLGSAAAEGWPALFCGCEACRAARRLGGKDIRRRTSYQLGDTVHVDFGPDSYYAMQSFHLDYSALEHLLITHSHFDHWLPMELRWRDSRFSAIPDDSWLTLYGNDAVFDRMDRELFPLLDDGLDDLQMEFHHLKAFESCELDTCTATPIPANHADDEDAFMFLLETENTSTLIAHDTGWFPEAAWEFLAARQITYALIDCTYGTNDRSTGHMGGSYVVETATRMREIGALAEDATAIAQHFSHNCLSTHQELCDYFKPHTIAVAYDGMELQM